MTIDFRMVGLFSSAVAKQDRQFARENYRNQPHIFHYAHQTTQRRSSNEHIMMKQ